MLKLLAGEKEILLCMGFFLAVRFLVGVCFGLAFCCLILVCLFEVLGGGWVFFFLVHLKKLFVILSLIFSRARVSGIEGFKANSIGLRG